MAESNQSSSLGKTELLGLLLLGCAAALLMMPRGNQSSSEPPVAQGTPMPSLMAEGWLNVEGQTPGRKSLAGKVVVLDFWATTCPPCRASMPKLAEIYTQYEPLGVEIIGLTPEAGFELPAIEHFLRDVGVVTWPIGYGAGPTLDMLGIRGFPSLVVFDTEGTAIWSGHRLEKLTAALDEALARK